MGEFLKRTLGLSEHVVFGNPVGDWIAAGVLAAASWSVLWGLVRLIHSRFKRHVTDVHPLPVRLLAELIGSTRQIFFLAIALYAGQAELSLPPAASLGIRYLVSIIVVLQAGIWGSRAVQFYLALKAKDRGPDRSFASSLDIINFVAKLLIWSLLTLLALSNLGINITALLAGLGVGGIAVALALQNILGDLFASLSIALDKPFVVGDTLTIDAMTGTVERIGIKTTRLRSESGELLILSNADILKSRVRNYARAAESRALAQLRIAYDTPVEMLREIPTLVEGIVRDQANARFERCHLKTFGDWALHYELSYFQRDPGVYSVLDLQQAVNLRIIEEFERRGIRFAQAPPRLQTAL